jgi:release factor glutamine methyltransferase
VSEPDGAAEPGPSPIHAEGVQAGEGRRRHLRRPIASEQSSTVSEPDGAAASGTPLRVALADAHRVLAAAGVSSPSADANLLLAHVLDVARGELSRRIVLGDVLSDTDAARLADLVSLRADRVPLQHLTGTAPFRGLELAVGPGVFVPRAETELVAGIAISAAAEVAAAGGAPLVVDLCSGSGAIALAVAHEVPQATVIAVEVAEDAVAWAARNVDRLGLGERLTLRAASAVGADTGVLADVAGRVDVVAANPPYIPPDAVPVEPEVRDHDPEVALYGGGEDGLAVPRAVVAAAAGLLRPGGVLVMEHGERQGPATRVFATGPAWTGARTEVDLTGRDRALVAVRAASDA